jgi:hypothetical protein
MTARRRIPLRVAFAAASVCLTIVATTGCTGTSAAESGPASWLFVWAADADSADADFLAVIDARPSEPTYGDVVATLPVGVRASMPHHTEYEYPPDHRLFANSWTAGRTFIIDLSDPRSPRLAGELPAVDGYAYPHSFARLPNGHVLATYQSGTAGYGPAGGLVELDAGGRVVRSASAVTPRIEDDLNWPYSLAVIPGLDRVVTTSADMGMPPWEAWTYRDTHHIHVWSLADLRLLTTVALPPSPEGRHHIAPAEPRVLDDGTVYVNTFTCGLYRIDGLDGPTPAATFVHAFPGGMTDHDICAVPVVMGKYWVQTAAGLPGLIALDVSDPSAPVEVSRLSLDARLYPMPHWLGADRAGDRMVLTGDPHSWILVVRLDPLTGAMTIDDDFRGAGTERAGIDFDRLRWPHGETGRARVHGAVFGGPRH